MSNRTTFLALTYLVVLGGLYHLFTTKGRFTESTKRSSRITMIPLSVFSEPPFINLTYHLQILFFQKGYGVHMIVFKLVGISMSRSYQKIFRGEICSLGSYLI